MNGRAVGLAIAVLAGVTASVACGKKGDPLPPLRPIPGSVAEFSARRAGEQVELVLTVPEANQDGSTPSAVTRIELYAVAAEEGAVAPSARAIISDPRNLKHQFPVMPAPADGEADNAKAPPRPAAPGDEIRVTERMDAPEIAGRATVHYVAVAVAGGGRGRPGPPSELISVPVADLPASPREFQVTHDESSFHLRWVGVEGQRYQVVAIPRGAGLTSGELLTPTPLSVAELELPVAFGMERCFVVKAVDTRGRAVVESPPTPAECLTATDRYPPPAPTRLEVIQEASGVTLIWAPVEASDLAGYVVLRAESGSDRLQPLMREPMTETTYRDSAVQSTASYVYAVIALDKLGNPSEQSMRQTITLR